MFLALSLTLLSMPTFGAAPSSASSASAVQDPAVDAKIAAAGKDVAKLLELAESYAGSGMQGSAEKVYRKVLELDANHEVAHKALRHQRYDGKWFESFTELAKYKREETARMKAQGLALAGDKWVPEAEAPYIKMGWLKNDSGVYVHPAELARAKQVAAWKEAGYQFRADDSSWVAPADQAQWVALKWKCGDDWLDLAGANEYHARLGQWWKLEGAHFSVWTTCDWEGGNYARWYADQIHAELLRLYGVAPATKPHFIVLDSLQQYNEASGGQPPLLAEADGYSSLHGAYFADRYVDTTVTPPEFRACGVSYWERRSDKLKAWGPFWLRWAAAQSYAEAIDPSPRALSDFVTNAAAGSGTPPGSGAFWSEKKIPRWLRYGGASYVERYLRNPEAAAGADPWTLRSFAFGELKKVGKLRPLAEIFAFELDLAKAEDSTRLYEEAGLVVAYLLDGAEGEKDLAKAHATFKQALASGSKADADAAVKALQTALVKHEADIRKFAGL
jgi:hypothetical protein